MLFKQIKQDIKDIKEVLTREEGGHLGSELDGKVEVSYFEDFKKNTIGTPRTPLSYWFIQTTSTSRGYMDNYNDKTIFQRIEALEDKFSKLEKYLGIEYKEEKVEGYQKIKK